MVIIQTIDDKVVNINGIPYNRMFQPIKNGEYHFSIHNIYNTSQQVLRGIRYDDVKVDNITFNSLENALEGLIPVLNNKYICCGGGSGEGDTPNFNDDIVYIGIPPISGIAPEIEDSIIEFLNLQMETQYFTPGSTPIISFAVNNGDGTMTQALYSLRNIEEGVYGAGGDKELTVDNLLSLSTSKVAVKVNSLPTLGSSTLADTINESAVEEIKRLTVFTIGDTQEEYLFIGDTAEYGIGDNQVTDEDFVDLTNNKAINIADPLIIQGPKGDPFLYEDFTPQQLEDLKGDKGIQGEEGTIIGSGEQLPNPDNYKIGDYFIDTLTNILYKKVVDDWELEAELRGERGLKGLKGDDGESAFDIWRNHYGDQNSTEKDYLAWLKQDVKYLEYPIIDDVQVESIKHGFGFYPTVFAMDSAGTVINIQIGHMSKDEVVVQSNTTLRNITIVLK